ncbi:hypothetical protein DS2_03115 [Catenovulum agarivorans DS-2]|uniref:Lipoprotein n=2 Tax=Catenovulum agarivorans TaxID=1172192 RepID=W7R2C0_9ALTE|nr:hypothetical protein DS2_03115 [Catenovulum agarivorans DS-2]
MNSLNRLVLTLISVILISACASQPAYRPAKDNGFGYKEVKLTQDKYRVHFKHRSDDRAQAMNLALLRAAEITKLNDYDWFVVTNRETIIDKERVSPQSGVSVGRNHNVYRECGLLGCRTRSEPTTSVGVNMSFGDRDKSEIESILEVKLGKGELPDNDQAYLASELYNNLMPLTKDE